MSVEIYIRNPDDDTDFVNDVVDIHSDLDIYLNQIRNVFSAEVGSIMGAADMGVGLDALVYETNINARGLERRVLEQIYKFCTLNYKFKTDVRARFSKGTKRDAVFIDIIVNNVKRSEIRIF